MCQRPTPSEPSSTVQVVIAGAGPAGLLLQALLHQRNKAPNARVLYNVTLIESRQDLGQLSKEELQANHRSWMIGLAGHGLEAIRSVPDLFEKYVDGIGVKLTEGSIYMGSKKLTMGAVNKYETKSPESYIVDRNFIVAALGRYVLDNPSAHYTAKYDTELLYVDSGNQRVLIRDKATQTEEYLQYDLLIGADGIRSTVREALVKKHFDYELQVGDIFQQFKAVHIARPESVCATSMSLLPGCLPSCQGICLPETGNMVNISVGLARNNFDSLPSDLKSSDPKVVAKYLKENFKAFELPDESYLDWATQWCQQRWNRTGQVYCNRYSSLECKIVIMGDAAHATSPSIGMGMNTALRDAQKFDELLDKYEDDLEKVLPQYSAERVPEGNALTNLAMNLFCFDTKTQMKSMVVTIIRSTLHYHFPTVFGADAQSLIGDSRYTLSDVYQVAVSQGAMAKHRVMNWQIRHAFFEKDVGMVPNEAKKSSFLKYAAVVAPLAAFAVTGFMRK